MKNQNTLLVCVAYGILNTSALAQQDSNIFIQRANQIEQQIERCPSGALKLPYPKWRYKDKQGNPIPYNELNARAQKQIETHRCPELKNKKEKS